MQKIIIIFVIGLVIGGAGVYFFHKEALTLSPQEAAQIAINFINENIAEEGSQASLVSSGEESGLYKFKLKIKEEEYDSYVTKDGKILFPQFIDMEEAEKNQKEEKVENLDGFAQCLTEKGAKFYGSKNCGWCEKQKELFGESLQYVNYIECIDPETDQWSELCRGAGVDAVPTWEIGGEMNPGFKTLEQLSELIGCPLE